MTRCSIPFLVSSFYWGAAFAFSPQLASVTSRTFLKSSLSSEQDDVMDKFNQALSQQQQQSDFSQLQQEQFAVNNPAAMNNPANNPAMSEQQQLVSELEALSQQQNKERPADKFTRLDQRLDQTVKEFSKEFSQAFSDAYQQKKQPAQVFKPQPPKTKPSQAVIQRNTENDPVMADYNRAFQSAVAMEDSAQVLEDGAQMQGETVAETDVANSNTVPNKFTFSQRIASLQSYVVGATMGMVAIAPFTALHHFYFYPSYQGLAAWEYDTVTAAIQGALFAAVYRYSVRQDLDNEQLRHAVVMAFVLVRSIVRVHVPLQCLALPLTCGEPFEFMNWAMLGELGMNTVESLALFATVADTMDSLLKSKSVKQFPR